jgi:PAS domain S-box-containing protein
MPVVAPPGMADEVRRLRTLYQLLAALNRAGSIDEVYSAALTSLLESTEADRAAILLFDEDGVIRFKASRGLSDAYQAAVTGHCPWKQGATGAEPIVVTDALADHSLAPFRDALKHENIRGVVFVPLAFEGRVTGKFMLYYPEPHEVTPGELEISQAIALQVAMATEHKRAEIARTRSEQRLQAILDNSPAVVFLKDLQGRYQLVNRHYEELFHVTKASVVGRTDFDIFPAELAEQYQANDRAVVAAGVPLTVEETGLHDDGLHAYIAVKFPLRGADGEVVGVCGIGTDIEDRKRAEAAHRHLAAIVESSEDAIIGKDPHGIITTWNQGAERIFGYTAEEVIGSPVSILAAPERLDEMPGILSKVLQGDRVHHFETRRRRKDGHIIDVALSISPVRDASGKIVGASKIARDITDRKIAEKERAEAKRTAELLNGVGPRLAAQLDPKKLVQEVTDIATTLVGAEFGSFFHNLVNERGESYMLYTLSGVPPEAFAGFPMPRNTEVFGPTFRGDGAVRSEDITKDRRYGKNAPHYGMPKGHLPVRSYLAAPVVARSGEVLGGLFFGHSQPAMFGQQHEDIVMGIAAQAAIAMDNARLFEQSNWTQAELKRSNEELRRANRDLEVFAYSASHDLQEPLRTIAISAQLLERSLGQKLAGDDAMFLGNIHTASDRMGALIQDLLTYARAARHEEGQPAAVDTRPILAEVLEGLQALIQQSGAIITFGELPAVSIHASRLAQVFQNLIGNAIKYRREEVPRVHISAVETDGWCVFSVADNGIGIELEYAERIFALFKRLHGRDEYPGSGIGLAICQRVVEQYGGRIWLDQSELGRGSTFCFSIPLCR